MIFLLLLLLSSNILLGQNSASFSSDLSARIVERPTIPSLSIYKSNDVEFGSIVPSAIMGSVRIDPINGAITHSNVTLLPSSKVRQVATFNIYGSPNHSISIVFSSSVIELSAPGVGEKLKYTLEKNNVISVGSNGTAVLKVGGTLEIKANQSPGNYNGTFNVTVNYNCPCLLKKLYIW